ncbi:hypothetical protein [Nocardia fusca]|uniref:hypothetical protein n=1 Tax=Nocardia fusca TaxID=941183 RepID=UPI0018DBEF6C|nr:hypothetical protein [Nocardia fusca]
MTVEGHADPAFAAVREVFAANLAAGRDLGAAVAVFVDGRAVVDLWGGIADHRTGARNSVAPDGTEPCRLLTGAGGVWAASAADGNR